MVLFQAQNDSQHQPHDIAVPLGDGGEKKFNWSSELSVRVDRIFQKHTFNRDSLNFNEFKRHLVARGLTEQHCYKS